ncbi:TPA: hypothetical protein OQU49_004509, partial [Shigella flexneri]|nr:hypothetical protein [Shigella flexneri]
RRMLEMFLRGGPTDTPCVWKPVPTTSKYTASTDGSTLALRARREGNRGLIVGSVTCSSNPAAGDIIGYLPAGLTPSQTITVVTHCGVAKLNTSIAPNGEIKLWEGATGTRL